MTSSYSLAQADGGEPGHGPGDVLSDARMREQARFNGGDVESTTVLCPSTDYPLLQWEKDTRD
jgi:hypothetical protein